MRPVLRLYEHPIDLQLKLPQLGGAPTAWGWRPEGCLHAEAG